MHSAVLAHNSMNVVKDLQGELPGVPSDDDGDASATGTGTVVPVPYRYHHEFPSPYHQRVSYLL